MRGEPKAVPTDESVIDLGPEQDRAPDFKVPIKALSVRSGNDAILECKVEGIPKPEFYWYCNNRKIRPSRFVTTSEDNKSAKLNIKNIMPYDSGKYTIRAINRAGVKSSTAALTVEGLTLSY